MARTRKAEFNAGAKNYRRGPNVFAISRTTVFTNVLPPKGKSNAWRKFIVSWRERLASSAKQPEVGRRLREVGAGHINPLY
jgi:hypothetical protein